MWPLNMGIVQGSQAAFVEYAMLWPLWVERYMEPLYIQNYPHHTCVSQHSWRTVVQHTITCESSSPVSHPYYTCVSQHSWRTVAQYTITCGVGCVRVWCLCGRLGRGKRSSLEQPPLKRAGDPEEGAVGPSLPDLVEAFLLLSCCCSETIDYEDSHGYGYDYINPNRYVPWILWNIMSELYMLWWLNQ